MDVVGWARAKGWPIVVGCDANAHHTVWASSDTNPRGLALLEFIASSGLEVANRGSEPTFVTSVREEVIDVTLVSDFWAEHIVDWRVLDEPSLSDHRYIQFNLLISARGHDRTFRNPRMTDWNSFRGDLQTKLSTLSMTPKNVRSLERGVRDLQHALISSYEENCPLRTSSGNGRTHWWNSQLETLRRETRHKFNRARRLNTPATWESFKDSQRRFKALVKKRKTDSWRNFCSNIEGLPETAKLRKVLASGGAQVGCLRRPDGSYTETDGDALELLLTTHFSGTLTTVPVGDPGPSPRYWAEASGMVTYDRIRWAISSFAPFKSAGPDGIFPALLREAGEPVVKPLLHITRASFALGHIPNSWREVNVVFIPKAGRSSHDQPKDFRPISLSSFLLKLSERLMERHLRETALLENPLHPHQHAYMSGRSTDSALHNLVSRVEDALSHQEFALVAFLDIEGAFDRPAFDTLCEAARERGVGPLAVGWIRAMLSGRRVKATLGATSRGAEVARGCPQGGVLSPLLWSLLADGLLRLMNSAGLYTQAYADDICIIIRGKFLQTVVDLMQRALNYVDAWCEAKGLAVNPAKAELMLFTKRRSVGSVSWPQLRGTTIGLVGRVKYLGVILDPKLSWTDHVNTLTKKATATLWSCRRLCGRTWGIKPYVANWLYTQIVRPLVTYGSLVWWRSTERQNIQRALGRVQRLGCLMITGALRTTPTAAMEAILGLEPLHLRVGYEARRASIRLGASAGWCSGLAGHRRILAELEPDLPIPRLRDRIERNWRFKELFSVRIPSRGDWHEKGEQLLAPQGLVWYTDGSKTERGAGAGIFCAAPRIEIALPLGQYPSVFQTEVYAITMCCSVNLERGTRGKHIYICTDSQAALGAIASPVVVSGLILECRKALTRLSEVNRVSVVWVPGHTGIFGNESADALARDAASTPFTGPQPALPLTDGELLRGVNRWLDLTFLRNWENSPGQRQAKVFIRRPLPESDRKWALNLSRIRLRKLIAILTGHCTLKYHLHKMGLSEDPYCRLCGEEKEETPLHLLTECGALLHSRFRIFGEYQLEHSDLPLKPLSRILSLFEGSGVLD